MSNCAALPDVSPLRFGTTLPGWCSADGCPDCLADGPAIISLSTGPKEVLVKSFRLLALLVALLALGCQQSPPAAPPAATSSTTATHDPIPHAIEALYGNVRSETLANGLRVYLKPVPGSLVVTTMVAYRVGSADEDLAHTGLAHYLEHLLFKGTDRLMPGDIDRITQRNGGANNAYTDHDLTAYHFDFAADRWDTALTIEADRMRNTRIDAKHEFELEKGAVIEELRMNEDEPWDLEYKAILPLLFDDGPYGHPVIGEAAHVRAATAEVITDFYNRWYQPNNASIVIVGGFDPDLAMKKIRELFEPIPKAQLPARREAKVLTRTEPVRKHVDSKFAQPRLLIGFNGVVLGEPDDFVLDVISQILSGGKTSRLYRKLIEELEIASSTSSRNQAGRYPGWMAFDVELLPEQSLVKAEEVVVAELERLAKEPVSEMELVRARRQIAANQIFYYEDIHELADALAFGAAAGQPDYHGKYLANLVKVTAADVQRVAGKILDPKKRVVVTSAAKSVAVKPDGEVPFRGRTVGVSSARKHPDGSQTRHRAWDFKSSFASAPNKIEAFDLAHAQRHVLPNGLTLLLLENHRLPILVAAADVNSVALLEPENKLGVAALTGRLLSEGAGKLTGEQIAGQIEAVGGALSMHATGGEIKVLSSDRALGLRLFFDCLLRPTFENDAFEREKTRLIADRDDDEHQATTLAAQRFREVAYGPHPFARPSEGTSASVAKLLREDCIAFHAATFVPNNTVLTIVGDFDSSAILAEIKALTADWKSRAIEAPKPAAPPLPTKIEERIITMPDSSQLQVLMGHAGVRRSNPDYYKLLVLDNVFGTGPGFTSRLSARLRDREGLAYSVGGAIARSADVEPGVFMCSIGTEAKNFKRVRGEIIEEINKLRDEKPSAQEVEDAKAYLLGSMPFSLTTTHGAGAMLLMMERHQLGATYLDDFRKAISAVTPEDVQAMAKKYLHPDRLVIVAAGAVNAKGEPLE